MAPSEHYGIRDCPFCGGESKVRETEFISQVQCQECRCIGPVAFQGKTSEDLNELAIQLWNNRK